MKKYTLSLFTLLVFTCCAIAQYDQMASVAGAKMYFSDKPFTNGSQGSKNVFKSSEFIYGRIELGKSLKEAFKLDNIKADPMYVQVFYIITYKGETRYLQMPHYLKLNGTDASSLNFDILPGAGDAQTHYSIVEDFESGQAAGFLYPFDKNFFRENDTYKVRIAVYMKTYDGWGSVEQDEKWPAVYGEFDLQFDSKDIAAINKNNEMARASLIEKGLRLDKLPDYFSRPAKVSDPALSSANIMSILRRDLPSVNVVKAVIPPFDGQLKDIAKNDLGLILFRYVRPYIRIIYKKDGKCYLGSITLKEDYIGGGRYGALKFNKFWGEEAVLDCALVK